MSFDPINLAPLQPEREGTAYRRVWRTVSFEIILLLSLTLLVVVATRLFNFTVSGTARAVLSVALAVMPLVLWGLISFLGELRAENPRGRLLPVLVLAALAANAVGIPLIERVFNVDEWLSNASGLDRIIGFTLSVGVTHEFLKFLVVRYSVWGRQIRTRTDGIAYMLTAAVGYVTVLSVHYVTTESAELIAVALRVCEFTLIQYAVSTITGYALAELRINPRTNLLAMPSALMTAALFSGFGITLRGGLVLTALSESSNASNLTLGLGAAVFLVVVLFFTVSFLINSAESRARLRVRSNYTR